MNVNCNLTTCSFILNSKCVFYEGAALPYTGINTNDSVQVALQKIEEALSNTGTGVVIDITAGTGISIGGTPQHPIVTNTAPDQTVTLTSGVGISVTGTYPNFTITNTGAGDFWPLTGTGTLTGNVIIEASDTFDITFNQLNNFFISNNNGPSLTISDTSLAITGLGSSQLSLDSGISLASNTSLITVSTTQLEFRTNSVSRLIIENDGSWNIGGSNGTAGFVLTSNGAASPPTWSTGAFWPLGGSATLTNNVSILGATNNVNIGTSGSNVFQFNVFASSASIIQSTTSVQILGSLSSSISIGSGVVAVNALNISTAPTNDDTLTQILVRDPAASGAVKYRNASSFGGITNTAANNEMMKSDGTNAVPSGIFSTSAGDLTLGTGLAGATRTILAAGSAGTIDIMIKSVGAGGFASTQGANGAGFFASSNLLQIIHNNTLDVDNGTGLTRITSNPASTNTVVSPLTLRRTSSGTPATGIGVSLNLETETADNNFEIGSIIESVTTDVTSTSEDFDLVFKVMTGGTTAGEGLRIRSDKATLFTGPAILPSFTVVGVPAAANYTAGMIYVSNESGGAIPAFSDGTNWRRVTDRAIIT